jgi:hypothetical protein
MSENPDHGLFELPDGSRVLVIDPQAKYIIQLPENTDRERANNIAAFFTEWWNNANMPVAFMIGGHPLVRLDRIQNNPGWPKRKKLESIE